MNSIYQQIIQDFHLFFSKWSTRFKMNESFSNCHTITGNFITIISLKDGLTVLRTYS